MHACTHARTYTAMHMREARHARDVVDRSLPTQLHMHVGQHLLVSWLLYSSADSTAMETTEVPSAAVFQSSFCRCCPASDTGRTICGGSAGMRTYTAWLHSCK